MGIPTRMVGRLIPALFAVSVAGCSGLLPSPPEPSPASFILAPDLSATRPASRTSGPQQTLLISRPEPGAGFGTQRMAYVEQDFRLDYFAAHQWVDPPPAMLEPVLVEALGASPAFGAVTPDARGIRADLRLDTTIEALYQDFRSHPSLGRVALRVQLVDLETGRILATRLFEDSEPTPSNDAYGGVQAINRVLGRLLPEVADFAARAAKTKVTSGGARNPTPPHEGH